MAQDIETQEKIQLLEKELDSLTDEVLSLRRAHRADLDSLHLQIEAVKLFLAQHHPEGFEERFAELQEKANREISPE